MNITWKHKIGTRTRIGAQSRTFELELELELQLGIERGPELELVLEPKLNVKPSVGRELDRQA